MPITDYDGQLQTIANNLGESPALTTTDGLLEAIAKGTENIVTLDSPAFTGTPTAPTPTAGDDSTKIATTEFIQALANILVPTGCVQAFAGSTTPDGWLLCDGSAVSRTDYSDLYTVLGDTYGAGDGSTTFNLPDLVDKFVQGSATAGTEKSAGLPNITGTINSAVSIANTSASQDDEVGVGALSAIVGQYPWTRTAGSNNSVTVRVNASKSNAIYGNSTTVQPPALTMRYIIKY